MLINKLKSLWKSESHHSLISKSNQKTIFHLSFDDLLIGVLAFHEGEWFFHYSTEFKSQKTLKPLVNFPSLDKTYTSKELWPFFRIRIPGLGQPKVKAIAKDIYDEILLLKIFGKTTISNPFKLDFQS